MSNTNQKLNTKMLRRMRHPRHVVFDEARIKIVERYKTSGMSGDEWRFSFKVEMLSKGIVVATSSCGGQEYAGTILMQALIAPGELDFNDGWEVIKSEEWPRDGFCCQPGCPEKATRKYVLKDRYDRSCSHSEKNGSSFPGDRLDYREFCDKHGQRGDCGLDDANTNYICIEGNDWKNAPVDPAKVSESAFGGVIYLEQNDEG